MTRPGDDPGRSEGQFSGRAIQRQVLAEALQHPATLYPFAACALAASYSLFVAPFVGGQPWALLAAAGTGLASLASFSWHYFVQGESYAIAKARGVIESEQRRRKDVEEASLQTRRSELERELRQWGAAEGLEVLKDLATEYDGLVAALRRQDEADPLTLARLEVSAAEAYRRGLDLLGEASELLGAVQATDETSLRAEVEELEAEIAQLSRIGAQAERVRLKAETLEAHRRTIELLEHQAMNAERLLHDAQLIEAALRRARVALPSLDWQGPAPASELLAVLEEPAVEVSAAGPLAERQPEQMPARHEARSDWSATPTSDSDGRRR